MNEIAKTLRINRLLDIYGRLLTKQQIEIMCDYYYFDLSLSEISRTRNITRTAVYDAIKTATVKLENFEENIGICRVFDENRNEETKEIIDKLERGLKDGI
jgi:hypothetical protein